MFKIILKNVYYGSKYLIIETDEKIVFMDLLTFKVDSIMKIPGRNRIHNWANNIVGYNIDREYLRSLSKERYKELVLYIRYVWIVANDNNPPKVKRPSWLPKKYPLPYTWKKNG